MKLFRTIESILCWTTCAVILGADLWFIVECF